MSPKDISRVVILLAGICASTSAAQTANDDQAIDTSSSGSIQLILQKQFQSGEAYVWYLLHCGYAIKTSTKLLIFDYVRTTRDVTKTPTVQSLTSGLINPDEIKDLDVYVFVSHSHEDHYDPIILDWRKRIRNLTYIFGWQATDDSSHYHLVGPRASLQIDDMSIYTINWRSGVPEVAYLVKTDGLTIFFQGDYRSDSGADIDYLLDKCDTVDMAFLGAHTRRWGDASARIVRIMERLRPRVVFPMHYGGKEQAYRLFARECTELGLLSVIQCPGKPGDRFHYRR
ncbi:MAG: MBL fold metallo-hydrolase [Candidatus Zixiibacteriota bacterium]|nr:MAG: MBL fold metallo-hydrolase [candidate division Zixibacteria bacterium]